MTMTPTARAGQTAGQIIGGLTNAISGALNLIANGQPVQGNMPLITGADVASALGVLTVAQIALLDAVINATSATKIAAAQSALA